MRIVLALVAALAACGHATAPAPLPAVVPGGLDCDALPVWLARAANEARPDDDDCLGPACIDHLALPRVPTLHGIECLPHLQTLAVVDVEDGDLAPLAALPELRTLSLGFVVTQGGHPDHVHDLAPLARLTHLTDLEIHDLPIHDLTAIGHLGALERLVLYRDQLTTVSGLGRLQRLETLELGDNHLVDLTPLAGLYSLKVLDASQNPVMRIDAIGHLPLLETLGLNATQVTDATPLLTLPRLRTLGLCHTPLNDHPTLILQNAQTLTTLRQRGIKIPSAAECGCC